MFKGTRSSRRNDVEAGAISTGTAAVSGHGEKLARNCCVGLSSIS